MTKEGLIEAVAAKLGGTKKQGQDAVEALLEAVMSSLSKGEDVAITGFGTFSVAKRAARQGINPKTMEKIQIAARKVPKFKAGKGLKEAVR
ncbi:MAG: DNA-binding protein HU-beta [candidate division CPR1 bacterium GW2011_GWA2_42_17]|uniref:DNA-binding protein HU-beta n=1 Tax=candidate division CPR1 bacterium GW2011_GWA2_42_17 TaxID=1618341 RepID=A0A0G1C0T6_9BACT|nr:MAG: DNA-binding protein HU-beta [candidate division CPR1 bacterium GW2011_GWA2_42_17]